MSLKYRKLNKDYFPFDDDDDENLIASKTEILPFLPDIDRIFKTAMFSKSEKRHENKILAKLSPAQKKQYQSMRP